MPRFVRNFWVEGTVDGVTSGIKGTGPRSTDGGLDITVLMREEGAISPTSVRLVGKVVDGKCVLDVFTQGKPTSFTVEETGFRVSTNR